MAFVHIFSWQLQLLCSTRSRDLVFSCNFQATSIVSSRNFRARRRGTLREGITNFSKKIISREAKRLLSLLYFFLSVFFEK